MVEQSVDGVQISAKSPPNPLVLRLQEALVSWSKFINSGDFAQAEQSGCDLVEFLDSISDAILSEPEDDDSEKIAFEILSEIHQYINIPSLDQAVMDALSFELPKAAAIFGCASYRCSEIAESIVDRLVVTCNPRDMHSILCAALGSPSKRFWTRGYFNPLLSGLAKVFVSIQRRHFEQVKAAVPVIINVLNSAYSALDNEDMDSETLLNKVIGIADSIQAICTKLEGKENKNLRALFGLFVLQIMAQVSISMGENISSYLPMAIQLSQFLQYCGLSYIGLITGVDVEIITTTVIGDNGDEFMNCFSQVKHGAALAVIWGHLSNEIAVASGADMAVVKDELQSNLTKRWHAVGMLGRILSCVNMPWELKKHAISFILCIFEGNIIQKFDDEHRDYSHYMPSLYASLQAIEMIIIYALDSAARRNAFDALKRVLADVPTSLRFDILIALTKNCDSSSMAAILIDCIRGEMHGEYRQRTSIRKDESLQVGNGTSHGTFWSADILELVELVLKPSKGGPPALPEDSDAVLSALNLYRYVLMTESSGKTNYTGVLSRDNLKNVYNSWLLPLRTLVTGIEAENQDYDPAAIDTVCALNPIELVLYRCIELVEEKLKLST